MVKTVFFLLLNTHTHVNTHAHTLTHILHREHTSQKYTLGTDTVSEIWLFSVLTTTRIACEAMDFLSLRSKESIDQILEGFVQESILKQTTLIELVSSV